MKLLLAALTVALCHAVDSSDGHPKNSKNAKSTASMQQDVLDHHHPGIPRSLQGTTCQTRKGGLVCETTTTEGGDVKYTANCLIGFTDASDCLIQGATLCYQYNGIPCISSTLCTPNGPIASDCSNIFAATTGSECSSTDCDDNCLGLAETPVDYNTADRDNTCMRAGYSTLGQEVGNTVSITNEWWHVLADGQEIEVAAVRASVSDVNYSTCTVTYGASRRPCSCSVDCPVRVPPNIQYDCGAYTDDACAALDCEGNCVNTAGAPVPFPPPPPTAPVAPEPTAPAPTPPVAAPTPPTLDNCELMIYAFEPRELCTTEYTNPTESGTIIPDGTCRTVAGELLPGNYRATCDAQGRIRFSETACTSPTCDAASPLEICERDDINISPSYLYSAPGLTEGFPVVPEGETQVDCITLTGGGVGEGVSVTFVIRGTCGPECTDDGTPPTAPVPAPTAPVPAPTAPVPAPTAPVPAPTVSVPIPMAPVPAPTAPVPAPKAPVPAPTAPVPAPTAPVPAPTAPIPAPTSPMAVPTAPVAAPTMVSPAPEADPAPVPTTVTPPSSTDGSPWGPVTWPAKLVGPPAANPPVATPTLGADPPVTWTAKEEANAEDNSGTWTGMSVSLVATFLCVFIALFI